MSREQTAIRIARGDHLWTRAQVAGSVRDGFAVEFDSKVTLSDSLHGVREENGMVRTAH
jgi:hypothetical protein